ncbi:SufS family cysteine desulfurase [Stomatohabitans albus]|uniref:aminotransferase class V-fold PLP-dependent enzyme n=1 Tax=Stomatohabitans albus TaxID=3110766 RepID=UPI00300D21A3
MDIAAIRSQFPALNRQVHGKSLVYLDSGASALTPTVVLDVMDDVYRYHNANVHRGVHTLSEEASELYEAARGIIANLVGADPRGVVFTKNATESLNLIAHTWGRTALGPGDILVCSVMEHHANMVPWQLVAQVAGFEIVYLPFTEDGLIDQQAFDEVLATGRVKGLTITGLSNVLGTVVPVAEMGRKLKSVNPDAKLIVDGAQMVPHLPVDMAQLGADALAIAGHKLYGPFGIGILCADPAWLDELPPFLGGGDMILDVRLEGSTFNEVPLKFEAGTPPVAEVIGMAAAVRFVQGIGMDAIAEHDAMITTYCLDVLSKLEGVTIHGSLDTAQHRGVVSFALDGIHPHDVGTVIDREGVAVRVGHHCAKPLVRELGVAATTRASFGMYTTTEDIDRLAEAIRATQAFFA